ncbi:hypothetical protein FRZ06_01890 [Anoxybacterium hadale]|uniref:Uncharacterized protein n=1 Tax=Anoxybacterium hadale TaxID=3408580 RepID=A0ACD1A722_9FIRM|nr:hypothetical protein FRZ06_01890 [Clostridiales bacterium]
MIKHQIEKGLTYTYSKVTTTKDAYASSNAGTLDYLVSTPSILLMMIDASTEMLDRRLPSDFITVGKKIELNHEHPSLVGEVITLHLAVENVDHHSVLLRFEASDSKGSVCSGKYERAIINKTKLLDVAYQRSPGLL